MTIWQIKPSSHHYSIFDLTTEPKSVAKFHFDLLSFIFLSCPPTFKFGVALFFIKKWCELILIPCNNNLKWAIKNYIHGYSINIPISLGHRSKWSSLYSCVNKNGWMRRTRKRKRIIFSVMKLPQAHKFQLNVHFQWGSKYVNLCGSISLKRYFNLECGFLISL